MLRYDDPWWSTHYPTNGWGCKCYVETLTRGALKRLGKDGPDKAPDDGDYEWTNPKTGETRRIPKGLDPGWDYNVGEAAWGKRVSDETMTAWKTEGGKAWKTLTPGDYKSAGRPDRVPMDQPQAKKVPPAESVKEAAEILRRMMGGKDEELHLSPAGDGALSVLINAESLAKHIPLDRSPWLPRLPEVLENPFEVWVSFEEHKGTGKVEMRTRIIKAIGDTAGKGLLVVAQAVKGVLEAWTMFPIRNMGYLNRQRRGVMLYGREEKE